MKNILPVIVCLSILFGCKTDKKELDSEKTIEPKIEASNDLTLNGNFIYFDNAAVLQTKTEIYGVITDSMMMVLNEQAKSFKKQPTDMVPVSVRAKLSNKKDKTEWKKKIEILEIIKVSEPKSEDNQVIKLQ